MKRLRNSTLILLGGLVLGLVLPASYAQNLHGWIYPMLFLMMTLALTSIQTPKFKVSELRFLFITLIMSFAILPMLVVFLTKLFNLDPHYKSGSHWVSMYVDTYYNKIYFFDSYGLCPPPKEITDLMNKIQAELKKLNPGKKVDRRCNTVRHQYAESECGVYSMYFILENLKGRTYDDITNNIIYDEEVSKFRKVFFRPRKK